DVHARAQFETGYPRQPGNDAYIPVVVLHSRALRRSGTNGEVEVRVVQAIVELGQHQAEHVGQVGGFLAANIGEIGHMPPGIDMGAKGSVGSKRLKSDEMVADHDQAAPVLQFLVNGGAENTLAKFVVVAQRLV